MNKTLSGLLLTVILGLSQDMGQMNQEQMQIMMQEMQKIQECMSKVDIGSLENMQAEAIAIEKEVKQLCQNKQRAQAQDKAVAYAKKVMNMPAILQIKECTKNSSMASMMNFDINDFQTSHVCDGKEIELGVPNNKRINW